MASFAARSTPRVKVRFRSVRLSAEMGGTASTPAAQPPAAEGPKVGKSGKKICCSCPETKKVRDECVVMNGEDNCKEAIEAHKACLRAEGFSV